MQNYKGEPFNVTLLKNIDCKNLDLKAHIQKQFDEYSTLLNGRKISGFKIFVDQVKIFLEKYNKVNNEKITLNHFFELFPANTKCIRIIRNDKVKQAVSLYKARYYWKWSKVNALKTRVENTPFVFSQIDKCMQEIRNYEKEITEILKKFFTSFIILEYETYSQDLISTIKKISKHLGVGIGSINTSVNDQIQRDWDSKKLYFMFYLMKGLNRLRRILT
jgi:LPS sulfotransferase NodH